MCSKVYMSDERSSSGLTGKWYDILRSEEVTRIDLNLTDFEYTLLISHIKSNQEELVEALINGKKLKRGINLYLLYIYKLRASY